LDREILHVARRQGATPGVEVPFPPWLSTKDNLENSFTPTAIASIAHCTTVLHQLRMAWTKDGWVDTLLDLDVWDEDGTYDHLDLDLGGHDASGVYYGILR
jgi:hypothetical protein